jgi:hypothetical protein
MTTWGGKGLDGCEGHWWVGPRDDEEIHTYDDFTTRQDADYLKNWITRIM